MTRYYKQFLDTHFSIFSLPFYLSTVSSASANNNGDFPVIDLTRSTDLSAEFSGSTELGLEGNNAELPLFTFSFIAAATDNFSQKNKLGQGGFGPVYWVRI